MKGSIKDNDFINKDGLVVAFVYDDCNKTIDTLDGPVKYIDYLRRMQRRINSRPNGYAFLDENRGKCALIVYDETQDKTNKKYHKRNKKSLPAAVQA